jgi:hypothetical protein
VERVRTGFAAVTGAALLVWWAADAAGLLGAEFASPYRTGTHALAEVLVGITLLLGAWLYHAGKRSGYVMLAGGFGALAYTAINAIGGYPTMSAMWGVLLVVFALSVLALLTMLTQAP